MFGYDQSHNNDTEFSPCIVYFRVSWDMAFLHLYQILDINKTSSLITK